MLASAVITIVVALVFYVLGLFTDEVREYFDSLSEKFGSAPVGFSGYYHAAWDKGGGRPQCDLLHLRERRGRIVCKLIYSVDPTTNYKAKGKLFMDGEVLLTWRNPNKKIAGTIHTAKKGGGIHEGQWSGVSPTARHDIRTGTWTMARLPLNEVPIPTLTLDIPVHCQVLAELITAHETNLAASKAGWATELEVAGNRIELTIQPGIFDPTLGRGSKRLLEYASALEPQDVLDLGFGCGTFGIYFAKYRGSSVVGADLNESAVYCASTNAAKNGVAASCEFLHGDLYEPVYSAYRLDRKFDLIIANLPFSRADLVKKAVRTSQAPKERAAAYRSMFASSDDMLSNVLYGAPSYLKPGGTLLLLTGGSADLHRLREASRLSALSLSRRAGDIFTGRSEQLMVVALQKT